MALNKYISPGKSSNMDAPNCYGLIEYYGAKFDLSTAVAKEKKHQRAELIVVTVILVVSCEMITWNDYKEEANDLWKTRCKRIN